MIKSRSLLAFGILAGLLLGGGPAWAAGPSDRGSAAEARAMLERAVAAVKLDEPKALAEFTAGAKGFRNHDLYVFCARLDGTVDAHVDRVQIGRNIKDIYDINGVAFGQEMLAIAQDGEIKAINYEWPEPASHTPVEKVTFFTKVADQVCGVGYYK